MNYKQLTENERYQIYVMKKAGKVSGDATVVAVGLKFNF